MTKKGFMTLRQKFVDGLAQTMRRFIFAVVLAALAAGVMIAFVHMQDHLTDTQKEWFSRVAMVLALGVPFALLARVLLETFNQKSVLMTLAADGAILAVLTLYLFFGLPDLHGASLIRYTGLNLFLWGMFIIAPFSTGKDKVEIHTFHIAWRLLVTMFYCGIIFGGLSGILFSLKELLNVPIIDKHYTDTLLVVAGIILPSFFFAGIPEKDAVLPDTHTKFFKILLLYVLMPILIAYTTVLYIYFIRMLVVHELPKNIIGNLVLWYAIAGVLVLYLARPETLASKWARFFSRWFPRLMILPLAMMFTAIIIRISQYGVTEPRYFTIVGGLWALSMSVYMGFSKPENLKNVVIPLTASLLALLTVFGPWGAFSVSMHSQNQRLDDMLTENGLISEGKLVKNTALNQDAMNDVSSVILYFNNYHDLSDIKAFSGYETLGAIEKAIGFEMTEWHYSSQSDYYYYYQKDSDYFFDVRDADYMVLSRNADAEFETEIGTISMSNGFSDKDGTGVQQIIFSLDGNEVFRQSISEFVQDINAKYGAQSELSQDALTFTYPLDQMSLTIVFLSIESSVASDDSDSGWAEYIALIDILD